MKTLIVILCLALCWAIGLMAFADRVASSTPALDPAPADAIVVLTGKSDLRIQEAVRLLKYRKGQRLLVSGVNSMVKKEELRAVSGGTRRLYEQVDLGYKAATTVGNAEEITGWAEKYGYNSLIVVTSDYHMPRALVEIRSLSPHLKLTPFATPTENPDMKTWWTSTKTLQFLSYEYCKYLTVLGREVFLKLGNRGQRAVETVGQGQGPSKDKGLKAAH